MSDEGLDAEIGLLEAVAVQVGIVIGAGLFSVTGVAIGSAGPGVAISYVVAMVAVSLSLVPTAILGSLYPTVGGNYRYPSRLWSPRVAFLAVWGMAVSVLGGGLPLYGLSFGQYLNSIGTVEPRVAGGLGRYLNVVVGADPQRDRHHRVLPGEPRRDRTRSAGPAADTHHSYRLYQSDTNTHVLIRWNYRWRDI